MQKEIERILPFLICFVSTFLKNSSIKCKASSNFETCPLVYTQEFQGLRQKTMGEDCEYYFAYGSNLNADRMRNREAFFTKREHAVLHGYKLVFAFNSGSGFGSATVVPDENSDVHGALYTLEKGGLAKLDIFEWVPKGGYERVNITVSLDDGEMKKCVGYTCTEKYFKSGLLPSKEYLGHLLRGKDLLPSHYYTFLENHECGN